MLLGPALALSAILFSLGVAGVLLRRNAIVLFMCIELMLNAVNLTFVALAQLHGAEGIAVQIAERIGFQAVAVYSAQRLADDITKAHYGYHFPLHCGSKGQVLLAYEEPSFIESYLERDLERLTSETITDPVLLRALLAKIRHLEIAITVADVQPFTG